LLRLASSATIRECQNTFGTATFRIRKRKGTIAFITLGKDSSCIFSAQKPHRLSFACDLFAACSAGTCSTETALQQSVFLFDKT
jgi:hypothetical protein